MARSVADEIRDEMWGNMRLACAQEEHSRLPAGADYQEFHDSQTPEERSVIPPGTHITTAKADSRWK